MYAKRNFNAPKICRKTCFSCSEVKFTIVYFRVLTIVNVHKGSVTGTYHILLAPRGKGTSLTKTEEYAP